MSGRFDSNAEALRHREEQNAAGAESNLEDWILQHLQLQRGQHVLDLGCGRGKQIFAFINHLGPFGRVDGLDISQEALDQVAFRAASQGLKNIHGIRGSLDDWPTLLQGRTYDVIVSSYAIYYAKDVRGLLRGLRDHLRSPGQLFVCGPGAGTNQELLALAAELGEGVAARFRSVPDFLPAQHIKDVAEAYTSCTPVRLANRVHFPSPEAFMAWWTNHNSYVPEFREAMYRQVQSRFVRDGGMMMTKNVLGIHAHV